MVYRYVAYRGDGTEISGLLEADTSERAEELLWQNNLTIVELRRQRHLPAMEELLPTLFGVKKSDLILFSRQLAVLLDAGVGILSALRVLEGQTQRAALRKIVHNLGRELQTGALFSEALAQYPNVFPNMFIRLVEVGEGTGGLQTALRQVATHMEKEETMARKVRGAMAYPSFVLLLAGGAIFIMLNFALPSLMTLFKEFKAELPLATKILLAIISFLQNYVLFIIAGIVGLIVAIGLASRTRWGKRFLTHLQMRTPVIGDVVVKSSLAHVSRTLSILLGSGVNVTESLLMVIQTSPNIVIAEALADAHGAVMVGQSISQALAATRRFPPMVTQMVGVGEETGTLETNLNTLADIYEEDTDRAINRLTGMLAPALIVVVGVVVGFIAVSIISPMYSIFSQIE